MPDPVASPTGFPMLPPKLVPWLFGIGTIAYAVVAGDLLPDHTIADKVLGVIAQVAGLLGLISPGLRKAPPA